MQRDVDVAVLDVVIAANVMSDPRVFGRIGSPVFALIARRFGKSHLAKLDDERVAGRWIGRMVVAGRGLGHPKLHMRRIGVEPVRTAQWHGANPANRVDDVGGSVTTERDEIRHAVRLVFEAVDLHFASRCVCFHPKRYAGLKPEHAGLAGLELANGHHCTAGLRPERDEVR